MNNLFWEDYSGIVNSKKCCLSQSVERVCFVSPQASWMGGKKKKRRHAEEGISVESRSLLIFISTSVCGVSLSTSIQQNTEHHIIPRFSVQLRLTSISLISIHRLIWQHVSKLIGLLFGALSFRSASCKYATAWGG